MYKIALHISNDSRSNNNQIFNTDLDINWTVNQSIKKFFEQNGVEICTIDKLETSKIDFAFFVNMPYPWDLKTWDLIRKTKNKNCLIVYEPIFVNPFNYFSIFHNFFSVILTIDSNMAKIGGKFQHFVTPQSCHGFETKKIDFQDKKLLTLVNANKNVFFPFQIFTYHTKSLYAERIRFLDYWGPQLKDQFDLFGKGWNAPKKYSFFEKLFGFKVYQNYQGVIGDTEKMKVLSKYRFVLCFENAIQPGAITEKIFDAFKSKCVPIYWGAPDISYFIPPDCFIDYRQFKSEDELINFIKNMNEVTYDNYIKSAENFMNQLTTLENWFEQGYAKQLYQVFQQSLKK
jgi:hypothetical protein